MGKLSKLKKDELPLYKIKITNTQSPYTKDKFSNNMESLILYREASDSD